MMQVNLEPCRETIRSDSALKSSPDYGERMHHGQRVGFQKWDEETMEYRGRDDDDDLVTGTRSSPSWMGICVVVGTSSASL
jgi:hypothetical protein